LFLPTDNRYRSDPEGYQKLVEAGDAEGVMRLLTNEAVEALVLKRSRIKAAAYGTEPVLLPEMSENDNETNMVAVAAATAVVATLDSLRRDKSPSKGKVDPDVIESVYRDIIIPMTKDVEVAYLFLRCGRDPPPAYTP
jgi:chorismate mutase